MKIILRVFICFMMVSIFMKAQSIHGFSAVTITGDTISLSQYAGKKLMIVNTASYCGYTPQFTQLQQLYSQYNLPYNFEILGFPCNDFGNQDPLSDSASLNFCTNNYNVTFQMMSHVHIVTTDTTDIYKWLQLQSNNGVADAPVTWNFNKFLIDESGQWVAHYPQQTLPNANAIVNWITTLNTTGISTIKKSDFNFLNNTEQGFIKINNTKKSPFQIQIYSSDGKLISALNTNTTELVYNTSILQNGVYVVQIKNSNQQQVVKFSISN